MRRDRVSAGPDPHFRHAEMKTVRPILGMLLAGFAAPVVAGPTTIYEGARVWTGSGFAARTLAVRDGRFVDPAGAAPGAVRVALTGKHVVPAYANAHAHITGATPAASWFYVEAGVFYVWNPNTVVLGDAHRAFWARPDTYDVKIAQGGITEPNGHPEALYVDTLSKYVYKGREREWFVGNAYHYGRTPAEIDAALDSLKSQKADFVKAYLLFSENYAARLADRRYYGGRGLDPKNMPYLVAAARKRGLRVAVHVETAHDLRVAAEAGAYMAAHLPGYSGGTRKADLAAKRLTAADAALVARSGMMVVPTFGVIVGDPLLKWDTRPDPAKAPALAVQRDNLRFLQAAGAIILTGTDGSGPIVGEVEHIVRIGAQTPLQAVTSALATGARLFPERRIGCFEAGCEADFLVLDADPIADVRALRAINRRIMAGVEVVAPRASDGATKAAPGR